MEGQQVGRYTATPRCFFLLAPPLVLRMVYTCARGWGERVGCKGGGENRGTFCGQRFFRRSLPPLEITRLVVCCVCVCSGLHVSVNKKGLRGNVTSSAYPQRPGDFRVCKLLL